MTREDLISYCLTFPDSFEDHPFQDGDWTAIRRLSNRKCFAFIYHRAGLLHVNLKCAPDLADFWRRAFQGVTPGYHMNKVHWNTVTIGLDVPEQELYQMISHSYQLTN